MDIQALCDRVQTYDPQADLGLIRRAYAFADAAHAGQKRATGEPYVAHPLATAMTLSNICPISGLASRK